MRPSAWSRARLQQLGRAQEAADVIGAERRLGAPGHAVLLEATMPTLRDHDVSERIAPRRGTAVRATMSRNAALHLPARTTSPARPPASASRAAPPGTTRARPPGAALAQVAHEIEDDRETLLALMARARHPRRRSSRTPRAWLTERLVAPQAERPRPRRHPRCSACTSSKRSRSASPASRRSGRRCAWRPRRPPSRTSTSTPSPSAPQPARAGRAGAHRAGAVRRSPSRPRPAARASPQYA